MASDTYHEALELLSEDTKNMHRGLVSLIEELEAIDWYQQRADACSDAALKQVLLHNRNEEIEHATMTLEWIRRHDQHFDAQLRTYLFAEGAITEAEERVTAGATDAAASAAADGNGSLGLGSLKGRG
jgi:ferritin-like protein